MAGNRLIDFDTLVDTSTPEDGFPAVSINLIERLSQEFPNRLPDTQLSEWEMGRLVGHQDVITLLRRITNTER